MSRSKRSATSDLNHDNWDQEEKEEEAGCFKVATEEEIQRRVIKRAVRRTKNSECTTIGLPTHSTKPIAGSNVFAGLGFSAPKAPAENAGFKMFSFLGSSPMTAGSTNEVVKKVVESTSTWKALRTTENTGIASNMSESKESGTKSDIISDVNCSSSQRFMSTETSETVRELKTLQTNVSTTMTKDMKLSDSQNKPASFLGAAGRPTGNFLQPKFPSSITNLGLDNGNTQPKSCFSACGTSSSDRLEQSGSACNKIAVSPLHSRGVQDSRTRPTPNKTGRSPKFLKGIAEINNGFAKWVEDHLVEDSTSILTRCFIDYIRHVQNLFDEEKKLDLNEQEQELLEKQESVLNEIFKIKNVSKSTPQKHLSKFNETASGPTLASQPDILSKFGPTSSAVTGASRQSNIGSTIINQAHVTFSFDSMQHTGADTKKIESSNIGYCNIPADHTLSQVTFYSEKPFKFSVCERLELNIKDAASFANTSHLQLAEKTRPFANVKPSSNVSEKSFSVGSVPASATIVEKSTSFGNVAANSNATEKSFPFGNIVTSSSNVMEKPYSFGNVVTATSNVAEKPFSFGSVTTNANATETPFSFGNVTAKTSNTGKPFSFGNVTAKTSSTEKPFAFGNVTANPNDTTEKPFSFGNVTAKTSDVEKPFSFDNVAANTNATEKPFTFANVAVNRSATVVKEENTDEEPPKVEFTQVVEEDALYSKRCKVFVRKDDSKDYQDRGIGTLYLKPVADSGRTQLIVRADTSLGNLLLNTLLSPDVPIQKIKSKVSNTVMLVCIPTPDAKPPPRAVLLRVKTSLDADQLIEKLEENKHVN